MSLKFQSKSLSDSSMQTDIYGIWFLSKPVLSGTETFINVVTNTDGIDLLYVYVYSKAENRISYNTVLEMKGNESLLKNGVEILDKNIKTKCILMFN